MTQDQSIEDYIASLPPPCRPGEEVEQLRREIGEMVRAEEEQWEHSKELDPNWPPSAKVYKRIRRKSIAAAQQKVRLNHVNEDTSKD